MENALNAHMKTILICYSTALLALGLTAAAAANMVPAPFISPMFGDNMVVQRGKTNTIWGWSRPGDSIQVDLGEQTARTMARADGRWEVKSCRQRQEAPTR